MAPALLLLPDLPYSIAAPQLCGERGQPPTHAHALWSALLWQSALLGHSLRNITCPASVFSGISVSFISCVFLHLTLTSTAIRSQLLVKV